MGKAIADTRADYKKHLRPYGKRRFWRKVRARLKKLLRRVE